MQSRGVRGDSAKGSSAQAEGVEKCAFRVVAWTGAAWRLICLGTLMDLRISLRRTILHFCPRTDVSLCPVSLCASAGIPW